MSKRVEVIVKDQEGLHTHKCSMLVKEANKYVSTINLNHNGVSVDIKSILGLMSLAISGGQLISLSAEGIDEDKAIEKLMRIIA